VKKIYMLMCMFAIISFDFQCANNVAADRSSGNNIQLINDLVSQNFDPIRTQHKDRKYILDNSINRIPFEFELDTGCSLSILNAEYYYSLNLRRIERKDIPVLRMYFGKTLNNSFSAIADTFEIGTMKYSPWPFVLNNEAKTGGLLGSDFLVYTCAVFICNPGILFVSTENQSAKNIQNLLISQGYTCIPLITDRTGNYFGIESESRNPLQAMGMLYVSLSVDGVSGVALLDTGSAYTTLDKTKFGSALTGRPLTGTFFSDFAGNKTKIEIAQTNKITIGTFTITDWTVGFIESHDIDFKGKDMQCISNLGKIGIDILFKFNAIIDYGNKRLYLKNQLTDIKSIHVQSSKPIG
jgi:hypothetical protein